MERAIGGGGGDATTCDADRGGMGGGLLDCSLPLDTAVEEPEA